MKVEDIVVLKVIKSTVKGMFTLFIYFKMKVEDIVALNVIKGTVKSMFTLFI